MEWERVASEARAFYVLLEAAMARVLAEAAWAKATYPNIPRQTSGSSADAYVVRKCITKGAFAELRAACVGLGSPLTGEFLDLEREIDSFASQWEETGKFSTEHPPAIKVGKHAGLGNQLAKIEDKATKLRAKAAKATSSVT